MSFLDALLENRLVLLKERLCQVAQDNGIRTDCAFYQVFIVSPASCDDPFYRYEQYLRLEKICKQFVRKNQGRYLLSSDGAEKCILLHMSQTVQQKQIKEPTVEILEYTQKHGLPEVVVVGGEAVEEIAKISSSYERAYHTLYYVGTSNPGQIYYSDDYENLFGLPVLQSTIDPDHILHVFRTGTKQELRELVIASAERVRSMSGYHSEKHRPTSIRRMFIEFTVYVLHIAADMSVNVDELLGGVDPYRLLIAFPGGTTEIVDWFVDFCETIRNAIDEQKQSKEDLLFSAVVAYVNDHITDYDLSLSTIGETMNISVSYLSRMFKKRMNVGFSQFVSQRRLELVCQSLIQTEDDLETIAAKTGYSSATYLGKRFKSALGCTPNSYRRKHRTDKN